MSKAHAHEHRLSNGLRVVCETMPRVRSAALGFLVATGSRHEATHEHGVSHFLEHMCFKGTQRRGGLEINIRFDELGSIYNAFTGKEHTMYYGWVPADRADPQLELLADMMRPALPPDEFETERKVILEEIAMGQDSFDHHVWNFLHETIFAGHPLAHEILGEQQSIADMPRETMLRYLQRRYSPGNVTLLATGALDHEQFFRLAEQHCGQWADADPGAAQMPAPPPPPLGVRKHKLDAFKQQAVLLVFPSVPSSHPAAESIEAFSSIFGGHNSRCYWNIVQKGICSQAGGAWISYQDCGLMALYADGEPERVDEMLAALRSEARGICASGVTEDEVQRVRNQRRTQLALEAENPRTRLMQIIDDIENHGRPRGAEERLAAAQAVTRESIAQYLAACPIDGDGLLMSCGPRDWP